MSKSVVIEANVIGQRIEITSSHNDFTASKLRVYVSRKMLDVESTFEILVNGKSVFSGKIKPSLAESVRIAKSQSDSWFIFDGYVDVPLP